MEAPSAKTIPALLDELVLRYPDRDALVDGDRRFTYRELRDRAHDLARDLVALGVQPGDKVAILMGNRAEWLLMDFAIQLAGAVMVGINTWATARELEFLLGHSDSTVLITADRFLKSDFLGLLDELRPWSTRLPKLRHVIVVGTGTRPDTIPFAHFAGSGEAIPAAEIIARAAAVQPDDIAYILYTSGSTSRPKGVTLVHRGLIENMWGIGERLGLNDSDRLWLGISLFWGLGCENALFAALTHATCIVLQEYFEPSEALRLLEAERITTLYGTPNMVQALLEHPNFVRTNVTTVRKGATIGSPEQMRRVMHDLIPGACQIYGLTESYGNSAVGDHSQSATIRATTVGRPLPNTEIRLIDIETGTIVAPGAVGEIRIKGYVTPGYYNDPERTAAAFDENGFFITGDLGQFDEEGNLSFRGRIKEMLKTGGINVAPAEIEEILHLHPAVEQAHVFGLPDALRDEIVAAAIVLKPGSTADEAELLAHCRTHMAAYKIPRALRIVHSINLPLTVTGKLQKNRLSELFK
jgi:fatty-acyl-CoA synthase